MRNLHHGDCRTSYAMPGDDDGRCCRRGLPRTGLLYSSVRPIASGLEIPTSRGGPLPHLGTWYSYAWATTDPRSAQCRGSRLVRMSSAGKACGACQAAVSRSAFDSQCESEGFGIQSSVAATCMVKEQDMLGH
jgi:hypothetical protein